LNFQVLLQIIFLGVTGLSMFFLLF